MGEMHVAIALRTFSGPNLGAEVMLPPGNYVIGTDYSCDVVLSDSGMAARHAALTVESPRQGQSPRVHVTPLDADVIFEEEPLHAEGRDIPPATPWYLGLTCLSWNLPHAPREEIIPLLPGQPARTGAPEEPAPADRQRVAVGKEESINSNNVGITMPTPVPSRRRWPLRLATLLLVIALGTLVFEFRPVRDSANELALQLGREVRQAGLDKVVVESDNDRITVSGTVLNEEERGRLWAMARNLKYPVYIRVGVREDLAQAVTMKFNAGGIFPTVTLSGTGDALHVAAYIKDSQTETAAFAALGKEMPGLPRIEKRIVHAEQLRGFIERELDRARLRKIALILGTGRLQLTDPSEEGNHAALERAMQRIEENLGIPLAYTIISRDSPRGETDGSQALVQGGIAPDMAAASPGKSPLEGLHITGVTIGTMRFVSLGDGQRIFEGGMLPSGHILEAISLDALILSKNGRRTTYPLRGDNE